MPELTKLRESEVTHGPALLAAAGSIADESLDDGKDSPWVRVGQVGDLLDPNKRAKAISAAEKLYYSSPLAHYMVKQLASFVVGEGFELTSTNPDAAAILRDFWHSPINNLSRGLYHFVQEFLWYGEMAWAKKDHQDGFVGVTWVPPNQISAVSEKEGLPGEPDVLTTAAEKTYSVISWDADNARLAGDAFFFRMQHLGSDVRGLPRFFPMIDHLRRWEAFIYNSLGVRATHTTWWDVLLEGFTQEQIDDWLTSAQGKPPAPGSLFAHNERATYSLVEADYRRSSIATDATFFLTFLLGSGGLTNIIPQTTQRRDFGEVLDPVTRDLTTCQFEIRSCFAFIGTYVLQEAIRAGKIKDGVYEVWCQAPRLGVRDFQRSSGALFRFVQSLAIAQENEWTDQEQNTDLFNQMLVRLGMIERVQPTTVPEEAEPKE